MFFFFFFLMIRRPPRSTPLYSSAASDVYKRQPLGLEEIDALLAAVEEQLASRPRWLVAAGSLPPGTGDAFFVRVAGLAARYGVPLALDTSGVPLVRAVRAGGLRVVKPNDDELAE